MNETMELTHTFNFEAAHLLPNVDDGHKCKRLHGHSFVVEVTIRGLVGERSGWVMDFGELKSAIRPLRATLDHTYLNEISGLENPTSENIAIWIWNRLRGELPLLSTVHVRETCSNACTYYGDDPGRKL